MENEKYLKDPMMDLHNTLQEMDQALFELCSSFDILHSALGGPDRIDPECIQAFVDVLQRQASKLSMQLQTAQESFSAIITEQFQESIQDPEDLTPEDFPLVYVDPKTGEKKVYWGDERDQELKD